MKKIMWASNKKPLSIQIDELHKLFGEFEFIMLSTWGSAQSLVQEIKGKCDEVVMLAPLSVINECVKLGVKPLYAEMQEVRGGEYDLAYNGRQYKFKGFSRIEDIQIKKTFLY